MEKIYNHEAEAALIASCLYQPGEITALADIVKPEDFSWECYRWAWQAMEALNERGMRIDEIVLGDELERMGKLKEFRGPNAQFTANAAISEIADMDTPRGSGEARALTVADYARKREIFNGAARWATWAANGRTAAAIVADIENELSKMTLHSGKVSTHTAPPVLSGMYAIDAARAASRGDRAYPTGLADLDKLIAIQKGELVTIAARPGKGKSALLVTTALNAARLGKRIKLFSVEMSIVQVTQRFLSQISGVSAFRLMQGRLSEEEWQKVEAANDEWGNLNITICDLPAIKISQVRTEARRDLIDALILDYVQLAKADKRNDRRDLDIGEVTQGLKALAKELDIPVLQAAQMSRAVEGRAEGKPMLSDLRESGSIENDSDTVILMWQKSDLDPYELIIGKHRQGPTGTAKVYFDKETMRFKDCTTHTVGLGYSPD